MKIRKRIEQTEAQILSQFACLAKNSKGRLHPEEKCDIRTDYQKDRDKIIHAKAFRRLKRKTQMFISPNGDHYRTRLTHTLEVSQVARTIARALRLNEDLTEAIALGHDLGHAPFGHAGESTLNELSPIGFKHYEQSLRIVDKLENKHQGLNLTAEVRDGIVSHTHGNAKTLEGKVVKAADEIAFLNHDIEDAIRAGFLKDEHMPKDAIEILGGTKSGRISKLVFSVIENSQSGEIRMGEDIQTAFKALLGFIYEFVYLNIDAKVDEQKIPDFIERLYVYFKKEPKNLPNLLQKVANEEGIDRAVCDYISGMTDRFAIELYKDLFVPNYWN